MAHAFSKRLLIVALFVSVAIVAQAAPTPGGVLKIGSQPISNLDPHFATSIADITLLEQLYQHLTYIDPSNRAVPDLATKWQSADGKVWVFTIRSDAKFNNGQPVTVDDVVASFARLRDPKVGSPAASLFKGIQDVKALDSSRVQFTLSDTNPEFASDVGDYHACIIPASSKEPAKERIGSGPFMIASYAPEDRVVLKKNPYFSQKDSDGQALPYLDEIDIIFSPDQGGQVEALRGGQLNYVAGLSAQLADAVKADPATKTITNTSNMHWVLHMRSDKGHLASDNRIREAFKLATDHQAIIDAVRPGLASVGNGFTPVGPAFADYYLDEPPKVDIAKAKALLAEAGYPNGLKITLATQNQLDVVPIATVWKEQMAKIGVDVEIQIVPSDVYYGNGDQSWLVADFGITDWGSRATPVTYFKLAYTSDAQWNESHWSDAQFDEITRQVDKEMDKAKRVALYKQAQQILIDRGPIIVPYFEKAVAGLSADLQGIVLTSDWPRTRFTNAYFSK
ncbi:MAG TPA: ABC transporter substrate-binding protein [Spirochaetia bacterium]|nr:ABC transporter substrate-binding protein [Spirochaetia bacterium]